MKYQHIPVMLNEVMEFLNPRPGQNFIDCTLGGGGYTLAIAKKIGKNGKILGVDCDKMAIENYKISNFQFPISNIIAVNDNFKNLKEIVEKHWPDKNVKFDGIVFDLGLSSAQLEDKSRGFSFKNDAKLNMAFGDGGDTEYIVNNYKPEELEKILKEYGEERYARMIAQEIIRARKRKKISTTAELVEIIGRAVPENYKNSRKINFATKTFQALRIATNNELENLEKALEQSLSLLKSGGRLTLVSFHSLEDRIVKNFFKKESRDCVCPKGAPVCQCGHKARLKILTKKIITPSEKEIRENPRSRSAKMRVAIKK